MRVNIVCCCSVNVTQQKKTTCISPPIIRSTDMSFSYEVHVYEILLYIGQYDNLTLNRSTRYKT